VGIQVSHPAAATLRALAHEAVVTEDELHPTVRAKPAARPGTGVILYGRATSLPFTAVLNGPERTTTDNATPASNCTVRCLRRSRARPIWLWEQGVAGSNPAVPTTSTNALLSRGADGPSLG
jgi:hypothetical protein